MTVSDRIPEKKKGPIRYPLENPACSLETEVSHLLPKEFPNMREFFSSNVNMLKRKVYKLKNIFPHFFSFKTAGYSVFG